ncbi:uncharacterized protein EDB91DRAFT_1262498 [Suillus paluster]|uniref:uncharacterized protein n=1 Tax=Suillus paluster TaxID=48578 RepID=UPI001B883334|nr:uncharacterized protein EDB91DRAFT_1262498 [Suillus paluster]KAG1756884.1 hypothetical protein EDB91DRAFT_1262498 [Suillus paluster]
MADPHLRTWYLTQRAILDAGTFADYMTALRSAWLESHWAMKLCKKVLGSQQGNCAFYEWALDLQNLNALLYGNPTHPSDLTIPVLRAKLTDDLTLKEWIEEVKHIDDECLEDLASQRKIAEEIHRLSKRVTTATNKISSSSSKTYNASLPRLGSLTETEHALLMKHKGCFKCRKFYVSHQSKDCTDGAPDASSYKTLTESDANAAKPKTTYYHISISTMLKESTASSCYSCPIHLSVPCRSPGQGSTYLLATNPVPIAASILGYPCPAPTEIMSKVTPHINVPLHPNAAPFKPSSTIRLQPPAPVTKLENAPNTTASKQAHPPTGLSSSQFLDLFASTSPAELLLPAFDPWDQCS